ncbi:hypothetical protein BJ944DRAFT_232082 [Cunninghamella echinulata]|nr:hypothetical protein BJ944DRAFT_232082 [Cunninghamella echinulata]
MLSLPEFWNTKNISEWSLTNYDIEYILKNIDATKCTAHYAMVEDIKIMLEIHKNDKIKKNALLAMLKNMKKSRNNNVNVNLWASKKDILATVAVDRKISQADLPRIKSSIYSLLLEMSNQSNKRLIDQVSNSTESSLSIDGSEETSGSKNYTQGINYIKYGGDDRHYIKNDEHRWIIDLDNDKKLDLTDYLLNYHKKSVHIAKCKKRPLAPMEVLPLSYIFYFTKEKSKSVTNGLSNHSHFYVMKDLFANSEKSNLPFEVTQWLEKVTLTISEAKQLHEVTIPILNQALNFNNDSFMAADIIYKIAPKIKSWKQQHAIEDTFIYTHLSDIIDSVFGNCDGITYEWSNCTLNKVLTSIVLDDGKEKKVVYKPDYIASAASRDGDKFDLFIIEVKAPGRNRNSNDKIKIGEQMKKIEQLGGLWIISGWHRCELYMMTLNHEAIYSMINIGTFYLVRDFQDLILLKIAIESLVQVRNIIMKVAKELDKSKRPNSCTIDFSRASYIPGQH